MSKPKLSLLLLSAAIIAGALAVRANWYRKIDIPASTAVADWPSYGKDAGGTRHSPLAQITRDNVSGLKIAWTYRTGDVSDGSRWRQKSTFEATPILADGTLYFCTPFDRVIALDPESGAEKWAFDPKLAKDRPGGDGFVCRGVSTWVSPGERRRIFVATLDSRLIAIDAAIGKPCPGFGTNGEVNLSDGIKQMWPGEYHMTSPPAVIGDRIVVGSAINDNDRVDMPSGVVRAYDVRTGVLEWKWDPVPRDPSDPARVTWQGASADKTGAGNAWSLISADPERDLVFVPTGSASPDHYGGERKGDNLYANSIVALRASTGKVVWHFQVVHHDLWDYDVPAQPTLVNIRRDGREIPALVQATKRGSLFILNRETGEPLFPVEERPVPQSDVPGEQTSPTQPFPTLPPPLVPQKLTPDDAWGVTPWDRAGCRDQIASTRSEGIFTPPGFRPSIEYPGIAGGTNWGGVSVDPERGFALVNASRLAFLVLLIPRDRFAQESHQGKGEFAPMKGTPYGMERRPLISKIGLPCTAPPWGTLSAVDLGTGAIKWQVPLGTTRDLAPLGIAVTTGTPNMGGPMTTGGGLTFIGAAMDNYLRAFDTETGKELWKGRLPAGGQATPMTYRVRENGKQYVVIAAGGHGKLGTKLGDSLIAFALP